MKISDIELLFESFKDAKEKFSADASTQEVEKYIDRFKQLAQKNIIKGVDKDIGKWIKSGWGDFKNFIDSKAQEKSNTDIKKSKKTDSITVYEDEDKMIVIPLSKDASCYYGKSTRWCTAADQSDNKFNSYFYDHKVVLFYILFKNGDKYAVAYNPEKELFEYFNSMDASLSYSEFYKLTSVSNDDIISLYMKNKKYIDQAQDINKMSEDKQIEFIKQNPLSFIDIDNPSEYVSSVAITIDPFLIKYIDNQSESLKKHALKQNVHSIKYIKEPTEEMKMYAVTTYGEVIKYLENPNETLQIAATKNSPLAIQYIKNPVEEAQIFSVKELGVVIQFIKNPSEKVQLAAVKESGEAIQYIQNPSDEVKEAAIKNSEYAIEYIVANDTQKSLHKKLWGS